MPDPYRPIAELIAEGAGRSPDKVYLHAVDRGEALTYAELALHTGRLAAFLDSRSLGPNDRVALLADNSPECVVAYLGVLRHGATVAIINPELNATHLQSMLEAVGAALVLHPSGLDLEAVARLRDRSWIELGSWRESQRRGLLGELSADSPGADYPCAGPDDAAVIFYTSGTEAEPKGVVYTHRTLYCNFDAVAEMVALTDDDRLLDFRSISWISTQEMALGGPLSRGATVHLADRFSSSRYFDWLRRFEITVGVCVPTGINMLLNRAPASPTGPPPALRFMTSSSAPLLVSEWRRFEERFGITVAQGYGSSEAGWISGSHSGNRRIGAVGKPLKYQEVRIATASGKPASTDETGEIVVAGGHQQARAYLLPSGKLQEMPRDGVATGDLGFLDADGYLHVTGRVKDLIIRGGVNIAPAEIDEVLAAHPGVAEVATIGVDDPVYGQEIVAFVVARASVALTSEQLITHCGDALPEYKRPKEIRLVDELPKTPRGKLDRATLAARWSESP